MITTVIYLDPDRQLTEITKKQWDIAVDKWEQMDKVILYEEAMEMMCRTACQ
ncbi:hypothetical protein [Fictibacillus sp. NRS-1165]|uniref:hypothetical protein n=1 Tax=Fictibacillus sp. NRS-1165 TaxID=3144463 RepID=UPI003D24167C